MYQLHPWMSQMLRNDNLLNLRLCQWMVAQRNNLHQLQLILSQLWPNWMHHLPIRLPTSEWIMQTMCPGSFKPRLYIMHFNHPMFNMPFNRLLYEQHNFPLPINRLQFKSNSSCRRMQIMLDPLRYSLHPMQFHFMHILHQWLCLQHNFIKLWAQKSFWMRRWILGDDCWKLRWLEHGKWRWMWWELPALSRLCL